MHRVDIPFIISRSNSLSGSMDSVHRESEIPSDVAIASFPSSGDLWLRDLGSY
jgi:hypothetical protein